MVEIAPLIESLVRPLLTQQDTLTIKAHETAEYMAFDLSVAPEDVGNVIGRQGRVAQALRSVVYGVRSPYAKRVRLNIVDTRKRH
ncbi:KH domain-containing protein [Lacticaseibacillus zhaodongensis]|uniref:KH domain-containing protein n=1 Tax=Lacticaseibacillus zhaodongensis TaxID=2668065 RepID=UPI0012D339B1|nr:KH domain-containing protein [Lacticaseibacillus zhaodongensis]